MSDIPNCSEIYTRSDTVNNVAITWRMCARRVENRKYPVFQPLIIDLPNIARHGQYTCKVLYCLLKPIYHRPVRGKIWLRRSYIVIFESGLRRGPRWRRRRLGMVPKHWAWSQTLVLHLKRHAYLWHRPRYNYFRFRGRHRDDVPRSEPHFATG